MYAASKIAERLALAAREFSIVPEPHSLAEVDAFEAHLASRGMYVYGDNGLPIATQSLTQFERDWMLNEQVLCLCDAMYAMSRYCYLKNEQNIIERFVPRVPQRILFDIIAELEGANRTLEIMILKARQLGCSTIVELLIALRIIFSYGVNAIIGSADQTKTGLMASMLFLAYDKMPVWLKPQWTRRVESDRGMLTFAALASGVSFQHGAQASGIARGTTPTVYHLSECASFTDAENQIESSLFRCVHPSPSVLGVLESSGEGDKGWWPDTWRSSRDHWATHGARLCPLFLPWFCGIEMYPDHQWITYDHPLSPDWRPNKDTREHVAKCELYVRNTPLLERHLVAYQRAHGTFRGPYWEMPRAQQWFWEFGHEEAKRKSPTAEAKWFQEMCADDEEALQHSIVSVFGHETIEVIDAGRKRDYLAYGLSGQSIEDGHEPPPEDIDRSRDRIPLRLISIKTQETHRWEMIPLRFNTPLRETVAEDAIGKLFVFHPPRPGVRYSMGIDTSGGVGEDSTVISVWGLGNGQQPDFQAAEFASPFVSHVEAYAFGAVIGTYYAQHMSRETTRWPMPYVAVEQVEAVGDTCQLQMIRMGYPLSCFHRMSRYDQKPSSIAKSKRSKVGKLGWFTFSWSRPILTGNFVHCAQNGWAEINSPWLIGEMKHFEARYSASGKEKFRHEDGEHDDRIFGAAMAIFCPHDMQVMANRSKKRLSEAEAALPPVDIGAYRGQVYFAQDIRANSIVSGADVLYPDRDGLEREAY